MHETNTIQPFLHRNRVYCAGPLFNQSERREMEEIAQALSAAGFDTFVPHADGMEFANVLPVIAEHEGSLTAAGELLHRAIFAMDVYQVAVGCGSLVFNLNGRVPDEGGVSETAIAWMLGKPLVLYKNDVRTAVSSRDNPLVAGLANFEMTDCLETMADQLREQVEAIPFSPDWRTHCPVGLQTAVADGGRLWQRLEQLGDRRPNREVAEAVLEIFRPLPEQV